MSVLTLNYGNLFNEVQDNNTEVMNIERSELEVFGTPPAFYESFNDDFTFLVPDDQGTPDQTTANITKTSTCKANELYTAINQGMPMSDDEREAGLKTLEEYSCLMSPVSQPTSPARPRSLSTADAIVPISLDVCNENSLPSSPNPCFTIDDAPASILDDILVENDGPGYELQDIIAFIQQQPDAQQLFTQVSTLAPVVPEIPAAPITMQEIEFILSDSTSQMAPSPATEFDSDSNYSASPQHSTCSDEDYSPAPAAKSRRGRKRKADPEFSEVAMNQKKHKNAQAAARYRQKKKEQEDQSTETVAKYEDQLEKTAMKYNDMLRRRNFMLELLLDKLEKTGIKLNINLNYKTPVV